jgi:hypothetical protein
MNEEQLADLLTEHLDALLAGEPLPETVPAEVAELLGAAQTLSEAAPIPRPEFGSALKESLLGPTGGGNNAGPGAGSTFSNPMLSIVFIGLLITVAGLALVANLAIFVAARPNPTQTITVPNFTSPAKSPSPTQTPTTPVQNRPVVQTPAFSPPITPTLSTKPTISPTLTATPIIDVLLAVTVTVEIRIEPPDLVPGSGGGGGSGSGGGNSGGGGDSDDDDGDSDD